ncbi:MAG: hypothetical protein QM802_09235 [Agriterribacter sp.]
MIKDFDTVKKQLEELSTVLNNFKSETVQLKILDLLFKGVKVVADTQDDRNEIENDNSLNPKPAKRKSSKKSKPKTENGEVTKRKSSPRSGDKLGPKSALTQLLNEDFFKNKKTIGNIVDYCKNDLATTIKSSDISGKLAALVRAKTLKRERNPETNQYEYSNY